MDRAFGRSARSGRMLKDDRARGLALEFAGNWLDFRRFEQHNAVDRDRFPSFDNDLREAMFQEPVRLIEDMRMRPLRRQIQVSPSEGSLKMSRRQRPDAGSRTHV